MISFNDFENPETKRINWGAYNKACEDAGERCTHCGAMIFPATGHRSRCSDCDSLDQPEEVEHGSHIRCPACGDSWQPHDREDYSVLSDGENSVRCSECAHEFTVKTVVSYTFTSPARIQEGESNPDSDD